MRNLGHSRERFDRMQDATNLLDGATKFKVLAAIIALEESIVVATAAAKTARPENPGSHGNQTPSIDGLRRRTPFGCWRNHFFNVADARCCCDGPTKGRAFDFAARPSVCRCKTYAEITT
jgi:hypothetical protein